MYGDGSDEIAEAFYLEIEGGSGRLHLSRPFHVEAWCSEPLPARAQTGAGWARSSIGCDLTFLAYLPGLASPNTVQAVGGEKPIEQSAS